MRNRPLKRASRRELPSLSGSKLQRARAGFTLVELLVVISLIVVLMAIGVLFIPTFQEQQRAARAAVLLQKWLDIAKQEALRDRTPHGIRLMPSESNGNYVRDVIYIEQAPDYPEGPSGLLTTTGQKTVSFLPNSNGDNVDLVGPQPAPGEPGYDPNFHPRLYAVQKDDYLEISDKGIVRRIAGVTDRTTLQLYSDVGEPFTGTSNWRIMRAPRPAGEETLQLPSGAVVDRTANTAFGNPLPADGSGNIDILFSPSGKLIGTQTNMLVLWVRDTAGDTGDAATDRIQGEPSLIAIRANSGAIGGYDLNRDKDATGNLADPYYFAREGKVTNK